MKKSKTLPSDQNHTNKSKKNRFSWDILPGCFDPFCRDQIHEEHHEKNEKKDPLA